MSTDLPLQIAETIQTASINRAPSPSHDLNPSSVASKKIPVTVHAPASDASLDKYAYDDEEGIDVEGEEEEEDIPDYVLKPTPRRTSFGPLPDLRFEQSYLASIAGAESRWRIAYITVKDQVIFPLMQGMIWSLALHGWRNWNRTAQVNGQGVGSRVRRWWYRTNNWKMPGMEKMNNARLAGEMGDFYQNQSSAAD